MKILTVDDSRMMRRLITGAAETIGFTSVGAGTGQEALDVLEAESADIAAITLDINMPGMSGIECLRALKADTRYSEIPVIMVTTESEKETLMTAIRLGARHYVTKPFAPEDLTTRLMEVLDLDDEF